MPLIHVMFNKKRVVLLLFIIGLVVLGLLVPLSVKAQYTPKRLLVPIGGGYSDIYEGFSKAVVDNSRGNVLKILVLPTAYATNPQYITDAERQDNLKAAEERRFQIEEACKRSARTGQTCIATLAPIFTRPEALNPAVSQYFPDDLNAIFILGGDQNIAMQVIANTSLESLMVAASDRGVIVAGTSAGGGMLSKAMLAGYRPNFAAGNSLNFGAVEVWNSEAKRGLAFGFENAIFDQHFYQRGRFGRLLNAISLPDSPHVGVGVDAYTGVNAPDGNRLEHVFGLYTVTVLDAETYHAADGVQYRQPGYVLSLRNILVHLLSPGNVSYDLVKRQTSLASPARSSNRTFENLVLPLKAGPLILGGNLSNSVDKSPIIKRFVELAGGETARLLVVAAGYPSDSSAQRAADKLAENVNIPVQTLVISKDSSDPLALPTGYTGIVLIGRDQSLVKIRALMPIKQAWLTGIPLLADDAMAAIAGVHYSAHSPTPNDVEEAEIATQRSFLKGRTTIMDGLGLINVTVEPNILSDNRWGRLFSLAYNYPNLLALGISDDTALEVTKNGARVLGNNAVVVLDLRKAKLSLGANQGYIIANGLMDVFAPSDQVKPEPADINAKLLRLPTPVIATPSPTASSPTPTVTAINTVPPTATPLPSPTETIKSGKAEQPTRTPRPTATPLPLPPPADFYRLNWMIGFGVLTVVVIIIGVWINLWHRK